MNFDKYHACGNDFILLNSLQSDHQLNPALIQNMCHRQFGIGADGIVCLKKWDDASKTLLLELYNSDGGVASMCANGTRCAANKFFELYPDKNEIFLKTLSGTYQVKIDKEVWLKMPINTMTVEKIDISKCATDFSYSNFYFANTGVPHSIFFVADANQIDLKQVAPAIRHHTLFKHGCNVNLVSKNKDGYVVRTFERGVEAETLSCGTGILAISLALKNLNGEKGEVVFTTPGGILKARIESDYISYGGVVKKTFSGIFV